MKARRAIFFVLASLPFLFESSESQAPGNNETEYRYDEASGKGPSRWAELNPLWRACGVGRSQSPINLQDSKLIPAPGDLHLAYQSAPATVKSRGHDIMVSWTGDAGSIQVNGTKFMLKQCHWHMPTEHAISGIRYDMELHLVHSNSAGAPAVVGILYKIGQADPFLAKLLPYIKSVKKQEKDLGIVNPDDIVFGSRKYYRYNASLSVPPCTEGVIWTVIKKIRTVSMEQVQALKGAVDDGFQMNARPLQPLYGRTHGRSEAQEEKN
eukprot:XP_015583019.1 alpha carbonic anhydrase 4 [Ricinus communis]